MTTVSNLRIIKYYKWISYDIRKFITESFISIFKSKSLVYVMGDSHTTVFSGHYPFKVFWLSGATAYNILKPTSTSGTFKKLQSILPVIDKDKPVICSFGEIDCRIHIYKKMKKTNTAMGLLITKTIDNYFEFIKILLNQGITPIVLSIPPITVWAKDNGNTPTWLRKQIVEEFNTQLKARCDELGVRVLDINNYISDEHGLLLADYTNDGLHLNKKVVPLIMNELKTIKR